MEAVEHCFQWLSITTEFKMQNLIIYDIALKNTKQSDDWLSHIKLNVLIS